MFRTPYPTTVSLLGMLLLLPAPARAADDLAALLDQAKAAHAAGQAQQSLELANRAVEAFPEAVEAWSLRGQLHAAHDRPAEAVADFDRAVQLDPEQSDLYQLRGSEHFKLGHIEQSIADFDRYLKAHPQREPHHWQRGISYYYAGRYAEGARQFERYQTVDGNDVENAVWRYICQIRADGIEQARRELLPIGHDSRVPLMEVYALFGGQGTEEKVLAAVEAGQPNERQLQMRRFYAHLYLGLYYEAHDQPEPARRHITLAATNYCPPRHYMGHVARVHAQRLAAPAATKQPE
jgi:lipoprotein NlpI